MLKISLTLFLSIYALQSYSACVKTQWANLKEGPSLSYETKWVIPKNTPLKIIKRMPNWYLIEEVDRVRSWVNASKLTESYFCGIVKWEKTRIKPMRSKKKLLAYYDQSFRILKFKEKAKGKKWVLVKNQFGTEGWVSKRSLWVH